MNKNDFTGFITGNKVPGESDFSGVREITTLFPWFHSAHLVLLKTLMENSDVRFDTQLHKSAMFVADRSILYNYLYLKPGAVKDSETATETSIADEVVDAGGINTDSVPLSTVKASVADDEKGEKEILIQTDEGQTKIVTRPRDELIAEIEARLHDLTAATEMLISGKPESDNKVAENEDNTNGTPVITEPADETLATDEAANDDEDHLIVIEAESNAPDMALTTSELPDEMTASPIDLLELEADENLSGEDSKDETDITDKKNTQILPDEYVIDISELKTDSGEEEHELSQADLIDKFIQTNPRLERFTSKDYTPEVDLSEPSGEINGVFITETLAKIYTNQGYYSKAINIYEKLTLQYPEKSAYFASRIEKIKDLIK